MIYFAVSVLTIHLSNTSNTFQLVIIVFVFIYLHLSSISIKKKFHVFFENAILYKCNKPKE